MKNLHNRYQEIWGDVEVIHCPDCGSNKIMFSYEKRADGYRELVYECSSCGNTQIEK